MLESRLEGGDDRISVREIYQTLRKGRKEESSGWKACEEPMVGIDSVVKRPDSPMADLGKVQCSTGG